MAHRPTVLVSWEMGGGMGHLAHLGTLMRALLVHGCRPVGVFRELHHVHHLIPPCEILAAPVGNAPQAIAPTFVYPQLLFNSGFHRYEELRTRIRSWQTILALTKPDLLICEHSPTALLAAHCLGVPACTFGTGFLAPPDVWPPVELIPGGAAESLQWAEDYVRELVNRILAEFGRPPLARVNELYGRVSRNFLVTFEELDHFAERRPASRYFGAWSHMGGAIPEWRGGDGPRIYAYLKPCPLLPALIGYLSRLPNPLLIYAPEVHNDALQRLVRSNVAIASQPVDMAQAAEQCDVALLNATHGTTSAMFLAGKPCFHVPIYLEQAILANRLMSRGAAMGIEQTQTAELLESRLSAFLATNTCAAIAANLADRYRNFDLQQEVTAVAEEIHQMAV